MEGNDWHSRANTMTRGNGHHWKKTSLEISFKLLLLISVVLITVVAVDGGKTEREANCESFRKRKRCHKDHTPHCLESGVVVLGSCNLRKAICLFNEVEDPTWKSCHRLSEEDWYKSHSQRNIRRKRVFTTY